MPDPELPEFGAHPRNIQYTVKAARLLNQTESGIARVFADQSENFLERQYGTVFAVLDLNFSSDFYDVGEVLIDTLRRDFYADLNQPVEKSFERALTGVNQTLADLAAEGQNDWVGKLNALVGVVHENELFLSQVGKAEAYMVRGPSVTHITDGLQSPGTATAKTFLSIASGDLEVGDKLLFATDGLFNQMAVNDIRRHLYLHPPTRAIRKMADELAGKGQPDRLAAAVLELTTIDLISAEPVSDEPDEIIMGAPRRHFETLQRFKPFRKDTPIADLTDKAKKHWERRVAPKLGRTATDAKHKARTFVAKRRGQAPPPPPPRAAAGTPETSQRPDVSARDHGEALKKQAGAAAEKVSSTVSPWLTRAKQTLRDLWQRTGIPKSSAWQSLSRKVAPVTGRIGNWWRSAGQNRRTALYRNLIVGAGVVLALSLLLSFNAANAKKAKTKVQERITQAQELQAKAEASFIFKDVPAARTQIADAKKQADALAKEKQLKAEVGQLRQSVDGSYDRISNIITVPSQPLADFTGPAGQTRLTNLAQSGTTLYSIGETGGLQSYNQANKETKTANPNPIQAGKIRSITTTTNGDVLFLTDKPSVFQMDATGTVLETGLPAGTSWEAGKSIDAVQQNIFILDPDQSQIWRHGRAQASATKGEPYLTGPADLKNAVDMVTGAQVYVLKENGEVLQFTAGASQPFTLQTPPAPVDSMRGARVIAANFPANTFYVADPANKRVVEFTMKGEYSRQFKSETFGELADLTIDDKTNTLYALAGNKVYEIKLAAQP